MEIHVHSYLSRYFEIKPNEKGVDCVYYLDDKSNELIYGEKLVKELTAVFAVTKDESKEFVNSWALKLNPKVNLEFYWSNHESIFGYTLPIVQQVAARTIGMDLVSVRPMAGPTNLLFMDYAYTGAVETHTATTQYYEVADNDAGRKFDNMIRQIYENQQRFDGELDHPDNT